MGVARYVNACLGRVGFRLVRLSCENDFDSFMVSSRHAAMLREEVSRIVHGTLTERLALGPGEQEIRDLVDEAFERYGQRPILRNAHGSGFSNCLWLFVIGRILSPRLIVESGVQRGQTTWVLRQAAPGAKMHCFDINLRRLEHRDPDAEYHETDWSNVDVRAADPERSLCFFDDHQSQALRIRQAYDRGFRLLLFDDTVPVHKIYADGEPPLPTVDMLMDPAARANDEIDWVYGGRSFHYVFRPEDEHGARDLIGDFCQLPDLSPVVQHGHWSFLSFVRLVD